MEIPAKLAYILTVSNLSGTSDDKLSPTKEVQA